MLNVHFDLRLISKLKEIFIRLRHNEESIQKIQDDFESYFFDIDLIEILLLELELINNDYGITIADVKKLSPILINIYGLETIHYEPNHPIEIYKEENKSIQFVLNEINLLLNAIEENSSLLNESVMTDELKRHVFCLGAFHNHFNRKEKLFFPILERYGHFASTTRSVWRKDDRIRAFYKVLKSKVLDLPNSDLEFFQRTFQNVENEMTEMIFQEEEVILPMLDLVFKEEDWLAVANESDAFGYTIIQPPEKKWRPASTNMDDSEEEVNFAQDDVVYGGGGYLTTEEAQHILNNLPLEITFVDKTAMFKYFNEVTKDASEMMLVRTPSSIGRNVANCHPPKSLKKVMTVIRELKSGRRKSESMWFKKKDQYIHITYKAVFNDEGEFLGILEYVQDIQPFFELPVEVKMGLTRAEELSK